jgi:hypothetical protein
MYEIRENDTHKIFASEDFNYIFNKKTGYHAQWGKTKEENPISCKIKHGESFLALHNSGPDGDEYFIVREANGDYLDMDYDKIDIDDFSKEDVATYEKILKLGGQVSYGAGRDG